MTAAALWNLAVCGLAVLSSAERAERKQTELSMDAELRQQTAQWHRARRDLETKLSKMEAKLDAADANYNITIRPEPFKAMTWNVLADGLSDDGFVTRTVSKFSSLRWDDCFKLDDQSDASITSCLMKGGTEGAMVADFIEDQVKFSKFVINPLKNKIGKSLAIANVSPACRDIKGILRVYGVAMSSCIRSNFSVTMANDPFSLESSKEAIGKLQKILKDKKCKEEGGNPWPALLTVSTDGEMIQALLSAAWKLSMKWDLNGARERTNAMLDWESTARQEEQSDFKINEGKRGHQILERILSKEPKPDVLAFQELDHYRFFQDQLSRHNYATTVLEDEINYTLGVGCAEKKWITYNDEEKKSCRSEKRFARASKFGSLAQTFNSEQKPCPSGMQCHDNDGVALFWNRERFEAKDIQILRYSEQLTNKSDDGVVGVLLTDRQETRACIWVFTAHLAAGDTQKDEKDRRVQVKRFGPWARRLRDNTEKKSKWGCVKVGLLLMMDGNSFPRFANDGVKKEENMYNLLQFTTGVTNFEPNETDAENALPSNKRSDLPSQMTVSVNKIRGLDTVQLQKIGEYQLDRIDYLAVAGGLETPSVSSLPRYSRNPNDRQVALNHIIPSQDNPSDHHPVVATVKWCSSENCEASEQSKDVCKAIRKMWRSNIPVTSNKIFERFLQPTKSGCESTLVWEDAGQGNVGMGVYIRFGRVYVLDTNLTKTEYKSNAMNFTIGDGSAILPPHFKNGCRWLEKTKECTA